MARALILGTGRNPRGRGRSPLLLLFPVHERISSLSSGRLPARQALRRTGCLLGLSSLPGHVDQRRPAHRVSRWAGRPLEPAARSPASIPPATPARRADLHLRSRSDHACGQEEWRDDRRLSELRRNLARWRRDRDTDPQAQTRPPRQTSTAGGRAPGRAGPTARAFGVSGRISLTAAPSARERAGASNIVADR